MEMNRESNVRLNGRVSVSNGIYLTTAIKSSIISIIKWQIICN